MAINFIKKGIDTSDANATAENIEREKTAYINGKKITGVLCNNVSTNSAISKIVTEENRVSFFTNTPEKNIISKGINNVSISTTNNTLATAIGLTADKVKKNETILGIAGTVDTIDNYISVPEDESLIINKLFTSFPLIDTSNIINMQFAFQGFSNLITIPELNTSNVTNMQSIFEGCSSLTTIPELDTSNVTNMSNMFKYCKSLTTIPELNTSKATMMSSMFEGCINLTIIPELDTSNATNITSMFTTCSSLTTIPELNLSKILSMSYIFSDCPNLSNDSLNNILSSLLTATSYTGTKTLKQIGLSQEQATTCTTLSNWAACETAGWTTGY